MEIGFARCLMLSGLGLAIASCGNAEDAQDRVEIERGPSEEDKAVADYRGLLLAKMRDPESTRFRNIKYRAGNVCGEFNSKNGYGGYDVYQQFYGTENEEGKRVAIEVAEFAQSAFLYCDEEGFPRPKEEALDRVVQYHRDQSAELRAMREDYERTKSK